jgi:hypothetical protein
MVIQAVLFDWGNTLTAGTSLAEALANLAGSQFASELKLDNRQLSRLGQESSSRYQGKK